MKKSKSRWRLKEFKKISRFFADNPRYLTWRDIYILIISYFIKALAVDKMQLKNQPVSFVMDVLGN